MVFLVVNLIIPAICCTIHSENSRLFSATGPRSEIDASAVSTGPVPGPAAAATTTWSANKRAKGYPRVRKRAEPSRNALVVGRAKNWHMKGDMQVQQPKIHIIELCVFLRHHKTRVHHRRTLWCVCGSSTVYLSLAKFIRLGFLCLFLRDCTR